jgi:hypothetical protein
MRTTYNYILPGLSNNTKLEGCVQPLSVGRCSDQVDMRVHMVHDEGCWSKLLKPRIIHVVTSRRRARRRGREVPVKSTTTDFPDLE